MEHPVTVFCLRLKVCYTFCVKNLRQDSSKPNKNKYIVGNQVKHSPNKPPPKRKGKTAVPTAIELLKRVIAGYMLDRFETLHIDMIVARWSLYYPHSHIAFFLSYGYKRSSTNLYNRSDESQDLAISFGTAKSLTTLLVKCKNAFYFVLINAHLLS